ncbi:leucine-rich repeat domain-containing protein [Grimontia hollisae]|uniref:hypothetical protein n=1 Tax=Grimontia hollisae TaxID=673 RepID=UPI001E2DB83B|nr:hypothetical protein [Grimontia hollisae]
MIPKQPENAGFSEFDRQEKNLMLIETKRKRKKACLTSLFFLLFFSSVSVQNVYAFGKKTPHFVDTLKLHGYIDNYGNIRLNNTHFTELPESLEVKGFLDIEGSMIARLPDTLSVKSYVNASHTPLTRFPNITVGGYINLTGSNVMVLPGGFQVKGDLSLVDTPIKSLPRRLTVQGNLYLGNTQLDALPPDLKVGGGLYLRGQTSKTSPKRYVWVEGSIAKPNTCQGLRRPFELGKLSRMKFTLQPAHSGSTHGHVSKRTTNSQRKPQIHECFLVNPSLASTLLDSKSTGVYQYVQCDKKIKNQPEADFVIRSAFTARHSFWYSRSHVKSRRGKSQPTNPRSHGSFPTFR